MKVSEAKEYMEDEVRCIQRATYCDRNCAKCELVKEEKPLLESFGLAIQSLEMQDKLKQWIENYKNTEFKDVMITRDGLIDILEEFRLECETDERNTV